MKFIIGYLIVSFILLQYQLFRLAYEEDEIKDMVNRSIFWSMWFMIMVVEKIIDFYARHFYTPYWLAYVFTCILNLKKPYREHVLRVYFICKAYKKYGREGFRYDKLINRAVLYWIYRKEGK